MPRINFFDSSITIFEYSSVWLAAGAFLFNIGHAFEINLR